MDQTRLDNPAIYSEWTQQNAVHRYPKKEASWISDLSWTEEMQECKLLDGRYLLFFAKNSFEESLRGYAC